MVPAAQLPRVKRFDQQGHEELETSDTRTFQAAAEAAAQAADTGAALAEDSDDAAPQPAAATPREVIEKLAAAKGELDVILDLINLVEAQQYLEVSNIALETNAQQEQQQQALRLKQKCLQLKDAGSWLRRGAAALKAHSSKDDYFFAQLAHLQQHWNIKRSYQGTGGNLQIDVALPLGHKWQLCRKEEQPDSMVDINQGPDGTVQLHSLGLPLPDQGLRWLQPLSRPQLYPTLDPKTTAQQQEPSQAAESAVTADTDMQDAQAAEQQPSSYAQAQQQQQQQPKPDQAQHDVPQQIQQQQQQQHAQQQSSNLQGAAQQPMMGAAAAATAAPSHGADPMQIDIPEQQQQQAPQGQRAMLPAASVQQQQIAVPEGLKALVQDSVLRCDRQLLARQEAILVRMVQQRVDEEVRQLQGPQDLDSNARDFVEKVFQTATSSSPMLHALQLRLLRSLLLRGSGDPQQQQHSLLAELQAFL